MSNDKATGSAQDQETAREIQKPLTPPLDWETIYLETDVGRLIENIVDPEQKHDRDSEASEAQIRAYWLSLSEEARQLLLTAVLYFDKGFEAGYFAATGIKTEDVPGYKANDDSVAYVRAQDEALEELGPHLPPAGPGPGNEGGK